MTETALSPETLAALAAEEIHNVINDSDAFAGYDGDHEAFEQLSEEVYAIASYVVDEGATVTDVVDAFFRINDEICNGERSPFWYQ